jgi:hypothetical protein
VQADCDEEGDMDFWRLSDGIHLHNSWQGGPALSLPSANSSSHAVIDTGDNSAGNGGDGYFFGSLVNAPVVIYAPINIAIAVYNSTADADQSNTVEIDQSAVQIAGVGGDGGNGNASIGGNVTTWGFGGGDSGAISTGGNQAGNGGEGFFYGSIVNASFVLYEPINIAVAGPNSSAHAEQTNNVNIDQSAVQMAGIGGHGGDGNAALGGNVSSGSGSGTGVIGTGDNSAGNGGDGAFFGSLLNAPVVIYMPINIAIAGYNSTADAHQTNNVSFDQSVTQIAGIGGDGGNGNLSMGGNVTASGFGNEYSHGWLSSGEISSGSNHAGNGGDGFFHGSISNAPFILYDPINIAIAGSNSSAHADQLNDVDINQSALQMAGLGGNGGHGNAALGGNMNLFASGFGFGSDAINTGHNGAGNGGDGYSSGNIFDASHAIYAAINIAMASYNSIIDPHQSSDQTTMPVASSGGAGDHVNLGLGGEVASHFMPDHHLLLG